MTPRQPPGSLVRALSGYLRLYHRHAITIDAPVDDRAAMIVCNHGFGGVVDLNVMALISTLHSLDLRRPVTFLVHEIAWTVKAGRLIEAVGGRPGSERALLEAFDAGHHVAVFPGGDVDASKAWSDRNTVRFSGRSGFARYAMAHDVPVLPIVTAGAGESLLVLSDGQRLAGRLGLPKRLRVKALPLSISIPWGLNVGVSGMLPYLPLPTKLSTAVLPAMYAAADESPAVFASRVEQTMQDRLDQLVTDRIPLVG